MYTFACLFQWFLYCTGKFYWFLTTSAYFFPTFISNITATVISIVCCLWRETLELWYKVHIVKFSQPTIATKRHLITLHYSVWKEGIYFGLYKPKLPYLCTLTTTANHFTGDYQLASSARVTPCGGGCKDCLFLPQYGHIIIFWSPVESWHLNLKGHSLVAISLCKWVVCREN